MKPIQLHLIVESTYVVGRLFGQKNMFIFAL